MHRLIVLNGSLKQIKVEPFNTTQMVGENETIVVTRNWALDYTQAIDADHPCEDGNTCDIRRALDEGFVTTAAEQLSGATECAHLDAVRWAHRFNGTGPTADDVDEDWQGWVFWFKEHATMCDACGGATFDAEGECGHCNAPFPENGWSPGHIEEIRDINERVEFDGTTDNVDADDSALVKQFIKTFDRNRDPKLYDRTVTNLPVEYDEAKTEQENA